MAATFPYKTLGKGDSIVYDLADYVHLDGLQSVKFDGELNQYFKYNGVFPDGVRPTSKTISDVSSCSNHVMVPIYRNYYNFPMFCDLQTAVISIFQQIAQKIKRFYPTTSKRSTLKIILIIDVAPYTSTLFVSCIQKKSTSRFGLTQVSINIIVYALSLKGDASQRPSSNPQEAKLFQNLTIRH